MNKFLTFNFQYWFFNMLLKKMLPQQRRERECTSVSVLGQRITTIQLDGTQYFISRMNPYSPELNYFLAYQYCRSIGLQLASFETKEKADAIMQYLINAGQYNL